MGDRLARHVNDAPQTLDYQPRRYRRTLRQRVRPILRRLRDLRARDGTPILPLILLFVGVFSLMAFIESLRDGPLWVSVVTIVPALGLVGFVLSFGLIFVALIDEANGWSRRWRDRRTLDELRRRTSRFWGQRRSRPPGLRALRTVTPSRPGPGYR